MFEAMLKDAQMPPLAAVAVKVDKFYWDFLSGMGLQSPISGILLW